MNSHWSGGLSFVLAVLSQAAPLPAASETSATSPAISDVAPPPQSVIDSCRLSPLYRQHLSVGEFSIVSTEHVPPAALREAAWLIAHMVEERPELLAAIAREHVRLVIMGHNELTTAVPEHSDLRPRDYWDRRARGLGATKQRPAVSCGAENLLCYPGDPYSTENILIHEFGHVIHQQGMSALDPTFDARLKIAYEQAMEAGLWKGKYAASNKNEYWAEGVQSWFDTNRENDHDHNHVNTRAELKDYDPSLARLCAEVFGDRDWRYTRPETRRDLPHLQGWDPAANPRFAWPAEVASRYQSYQRAMRGEPLQPDDPWVDVPLAVEPDASGLKSPRSRQATDLLFVNQSPSTVQIEWIDFEGKLRPNGEVRPGGSEQIHSFDSHLFRLSTGGRLLGYAAATSKNGRVLIPAPVEPKAP